MKKWRDKGMRGWDSQALTLQSSQISGDANYSFAVSRTSAYNWLLIRKLAISTS